MNGVPQIVIDCPYCNGVGSWFGVVPPSPCGPNCMGAVTTPTAPPRVQYYDLTQTSRDTVGLRSTSAQGIVIGGGTTGLAPTPTYKLSDTDVARIAEQVADQIAKRLMRR